MTHPMSLRGLCREEGPGGHRAEITWGQDGCEVGAGDISGALTGDAQGPLQVKGRAGCPELLSTAQTGSSRLTPTCGGSALEMPPASPLVFRAQEVLAGERL